MEDIWHENGKRNPWRRMVGVGGVEGRGLAEWGRRINETKILGTSQKETCSFLC